MKYAYLPAVFATAAPLALAAQITLGEATLPEAGDRFESVVDTTYADANGNVARAGADQTWIFGDVTAQGVTCTSFRAASAGAAAAEFPDATLVVTTGVSCGDEGAEVYLQRSGNDLNIVGLGTSVVAGGGGGALPTVRLAQPLLYQRAPLRFGDAGSATASQRLAFGGEALAVLLGNPSIAALVDSVRVDLSLEASIEADAWGRAGESAAELTEVLRVRRETTTSQTFEAKVPLLGWVDPSTIPGLDLSQLPPPEQTIVNYEWWSADEAAPLYRVSFDSVGAQAVAERSGAVSSAVEVAGAEDAVGLHLEGGSLVVARAGARAAALEVDVYDVTGARVAAVALATGQPEARLATDGWAGGLYVVRVSGSGVGETHRFMVTR